MKASGPRLALAALALTGAACSVPTAVPVEPKVTQSQTDAQARRALSYLTVGNKSSAHKLLRDWSLKTKCWTGMTFAYFRTLEIEQEAFAGLDVPERFEVVSHLTAPTDPGLGKGVVGMITAVDCDKRPTV